MDNQLTIKEKATKLLQDRFFRIFPDHSQGYPADRMKSYGFQPEAMKFTLFKNGETHFSILEDGSWTEPIPTQNDELVIQAIWEMEGHEEREGHAEPDTFEKLTPEDYKASFLNQNRAPGQIVVESDVASGQDSDRKDYPDDMNLKRLEDENVLIQTSPWTKEEKQKLNQIIENRKQ